MGKFEVFPAENGQFYFRLKAGNGEIILASEGYTTRASAHDGISSVRSNCQIESRYDRRTASDGRFYFVLKAANGQIIGNSQMYSTPSCVTTGIASVTANGTSQSVEDL